MSCHLIRFLFFRASATEASSRNSGSVPTKHTGSSPFIFIYLFLSFIHANDLALLQLHNRELCGHKNTHVSKYTSNQTVLLLTKLFPGAS